MSRWNIKFECLYCGHRFETYIWGEDDSGVTCVKCKSRIKSLIDVPFEPGRGRDAFGYEVKPKIK